MVGATIVTRPADPVSFGLAAVRTAAGNAAGRVRVVTGHSGPPESFAIRASGGAITITGADATGAMYGALEFAERVRMRGDAAWKEDARGEPYLRDRAVNLFLTLPWSYERNNTDYDPEALTDPGRWWFQNDDYWNTLLDIMAEARLNWLDIHGTWDISVTDSPNIYAYFIQSDTYPAVGVDPAVKAANLARLNRVIEMARARGIRVSLMAYQTNLEIPPSRRTPYAATEQVVYDYTREVVEKMIRQAPDLAGIGFRIGESRQSAQFFTCYLEAVRRSGRGVPLITRSWLTRKQRILDLARAYPDLTVEIKYTGEQWGPPYIVSGGRMANWYSYSYEDYLSDSGATRGAKLWPGNPAAGGGRWPPEPYKIVWQVRANGTHRVFSVYEPDYVRNSIRAMRIGAASGYTVEGLDAYYPKSPRYYLADSSDQYCDWTHQRDELYWRLWGRLGYDPDTPEAVFQARLDDWFGNQGSQVARTWKAASRIVPIAYTAFCLGPDHRDQAPELETGGSTGDFVQSEPFDSLAVRPLRVEMAEAALGIEDGRPGLGTVASMLDAYARQVRDGVRAIDASSIPGTAAKRLNELSTDCEMLADLAQYYAGRFRSARDLAMIESTTGAAATNDALMKDFAEALEGWQRLGDSPEARFFRPFTERLRMTTNSFHWKNLLPRVADEADALSRLIRVPELPPGASPPAAAPRDMRLDWKPSGAEIECSVPAHGIDAAWLLVKPLPSTAFFHRVAMRRSGGRWVARFARERWGHCVAAEIAIGSARARLPGSLDAGTPYLVIPSLPGPTPELYASDQALDFLQPASLDPTRHGLLLIGSGGTNTLRHFDTTQRRKLTDAVARGMTLLVLDQDYFDRSQLEWLPKPLAVVHERAHLFDPGGALGLPSIRLQDIVLERFAESDGWTLSAGGAIALTNHGRGAIRLVQARLEANLQFAPCAVALARLLRSSDKPLVLVDPGNSGGRRTSALLPDLLNALDQPFLTLGEVIAQEQGMNSFTPVAGPIRDDDVLAGKGAASMKAFLDAEVKAKAARQIPATRAAYERIRGPRKAELMRTLGLSPEPPRSPLNARITRTFRRQGYRVENLVLESRPEFFVTAQVYVPDKPKDEKLPVIINPHGHWEHKKAEPVVQARCIFQAMRGYLAVVVDSPGWSFEGDARIERRGEGPHNDFKLLEGGTNATGYYVWDLMRVLDWVASREDADMDRVGITGASGGGLATMYAFAADDRYKCAVPVVYMASMELAPWNGCLCNHVPGTLQIGDRSDVIGIQAPKPVLIIGAENDGEFPPAAMRLTAQKMQRIWALFEAESDAQSAIFPGPHDYSQPMRELAMGFFDRYLKHAGSGAPVAEPGIHTEDPNSPEMFVLPDGLVRERTMRDLAMESLRAAGPASWPDVVRVNGGLPAQSPLNYKELDAGRRRHIVFESEPGLTIPGILVLPRGTPAGVKIFVSDRGKLAALTDLDVERNAADGYACLSIDPRGCGELAPIDQRLTTYLGVSIPFAQGWDIARAAEVMRRYSHNVTVVGTGPIAGQSVMFAALINADIRGVTAHDCLREFADVLRSNVPDAAVQPRANLCGSLDRLRALAKNGRWRYLGAARRNRGAGSS